MSGGELIQKGLPMKQFIAPKAITINGKHSPCKCEDGVICEYCVQASLILWDREEEKARESQNGLLEAMKKTGVRKVGRLLAVDHKTVSHWIKSGNISTEHLAQLQRILQPNGAIGIL
jgi:hypothetical protein